MSDDAAGTEAPSLVPDDLKGMVLETDAFKKAQTQTEYAMEQSRKAKLPEEDDDPILDPDTLKATVELLGTVSSIRRETEKARLATSEPFRDAAAEINVQFNELLSPVKGVEARLKEVVAAHNAAEEEKRQAEARRQEELARKRQAEEDARVKAEREQKGKEREPVQHTPPPPPPEKKTERADSGAAVVMMTTWHYEVEDMGALPDAYKITKPDDAALKEAVKNGVREIPGVKIFSKKTPSVRS